MNTYFDHSNEISIIFPLKPFCRATNEDEMCNFYLMYYVENDEPLERKYCFSFGPPRYYWKNSENNLANIPDEDASLLDE